MSLCKDLLELIVCPQCKGTLIYLPEPEKLKCEKCRLIYRVEDDLPILLIEEAEKY